MDKYFNKEYQYGDIISILIQDYNNKYEHKDILFIRTPTTGEFLDNLFLEEDITRIMYYCDEIPKNYNKNTIITESENLEKTLLSINKKFDMVCLDSYHEYIYSIRDLTLISSYLTETGVIISHDCFPPCKEMAIPKYKSGGWCGETYIAFIEFAYNNPNYYYTILNIDTGIGIISKIELENLKNIFNKDKQEKLILMHKNSDDDKYNYFCENSVEIINTIHPNLL